jgi:uncharacterized protein
VNPFFWCKRLLGQKDKKTLSLSPLLCVGPLIFMAILSVACARGGSPPAASAGPSAVFPSGVALRLDLAITPEEQERGLMFVDFLPDDRGMLFLYKSDETRSFWMKNCKIPLDLLWLAADGTVVDISAKVPPCAVDPCPTYESSRPARYTLEVRGGLATEKGLKIGDRVLLLNLQDQIPVQ